MEREDSKKTVMNGHFFIVDHINGAQHVSIIGNGDLNSTLSSLQITAGLSPSDYYVTCHGKIVENNIIKRDHVYHVVPRLYGGKGGFGSMLRAIGAQIEKTTNHEACRDISGRRMRDVNNERELREWIAKKAEKEKQRELERQERISRKRALPNHKFDDPLYDQQKAKVTENLEDAFKTGFAKTQTKDAGPSYADAPGAAGCSYAGRKRKAEPSATASAPKKSTEWLGINMDDLSDSSSDDDQESGDSNMASAGDLDFQIGDNLQRTTSNDTDNNCDNVNSDSVQTQDTDKSPNVPEPGVTCSEGSDETSTESSGATGSDQLCNPDKGPIDLNEYSSAAELEILGLDTLKSELMSRGLKCGGSLQERANRLFSVQGLNSDQYDPSLLAKPSKKKKN